MGARVGMGDAMYLAKPEKGLSENPERATGYRRVW